MGPGLPEQSARPLHRQSDRREPRGSDEERTLPRRSRAASTSWTLRDVYGLPGPRTTTSPALSLHPGAHRWVLPGMSRRKAPASPEACRHHRATLMLFGLERTVFRPPDAVRQRRHCGLSLIRTWPPADPWLQLVITAATATSVCEVSDASTAAPCMGPGLWAGAARSATGGRSCCLSGRPAGGRLGRSWVPDGTSPGLRGLLRLGDGPQARAPSKMVPARYSTPAHGGFLSDLCHLQGPRPCQSLQPTRARCSGAWPRWKVV